MASEENVPFDPTSFEHIPVLLNECLEGLAIDPAGTYLDGTAGGAGHSRQIALRLDAAKGGRLISLDQDPDAVQTARARLAGLPATVVQINFRYAGQALEELGIDKINGALLDLGVSSHQLDDAARGFSYRADAPLDMRMSQQGETAADLVNTQQAPGTPPGRSPSAMAEETSSTMSEGARGVFWLAYTAAESFGLRNRSITPW